MNLNSASFDFVQDELERTKNIDHVLADLYTQISATQKFIDEDGLHFTYIYRSFAVLEQLVTHNKEHLEEVLKKLEADL